MSAPAALPPQPAPAPQPEPVNHLTEITLDEISGGPSPMHQTPPVVVPAAAPPVQPPAPAPAPAAPSIEEDPLAFLNAPKPAETLESPPDPNEPPAPNDPKWYREAIAAQKTRYDTEIQAARAEAEQARQAAEEHARQLEQIRSEASLVDPSLSPEVTAVSNRLTGQIQDTARLLPPASAREFIKTGKNLIEKYSKLGEVFEDGYDERYNELRKEVQTTYGKDTDEVWRNLPQLARTVNEMKEQIQRVSGNSDDVIYGRMERVYLEANKSLDEILDTTLSYSEELARGTPFAPQNIIARLMEGVPEFKTQSEQLKKFLKDTLIPPRPIPKATLATMTPAERAEAQNRHAMAHQASYQALHRQIPLALHTMTALPMLANMLNQKNAEIKRLQAMLPPAEGLQIPGQYQHRPAETGHRPGQITPITMDEIAR